MGRGAASRSVVTTLFCAPAHADVTADQAWTAAEAAWEAVGFAVDAVPDRGADILAMRDIVLRPSPAADLGELEITVPDLVLRKAEDRRVMVATQGENVLVLTLDMGHGSRCTSELTVTWEGRRAEASGSRGNVTFSFGADAASWSFVSFPSDDAGEPEPALPGCGSSVETTRTGSHSAITATAYVVLRVGGGVHLTYNQRTEPSRYESVLASQDGIVGPGAEDTGRGSGRSEGHQLRAELSLPPPSAPGALDLQAAVRAGLVADKSKVGTGVVQQTARGDEQDREPVDGMAFGSFDQCWHLDRTGLRLEARLADLEWLLGDGLSPEPFTVTVTVTVTVPALDGRLAVPALLEPSPQPASLDLTVDGVSLTEWFWRQFDPENRLPREPAALDMSLSSHLTAFMEPLSFVNARGLMLWGPLAGLQGVLGASGEPSEAVLDRFNLRVLGLTGSVEEAFIVDTARFDDLTGMPRMEGRAEANVSGVQAVLDRFIAIEGPVAEWARAARYGFAAFFDSTGPDASRSVIQTTPEGRLLINGQEMF